MSPYAQYCYLGYVISSIYLYTQVSDNERLGQRNVTVNEGVM